MDRISSITMHGIKSTNAKQPLTGRDIIIGHNGSGKTTRAQAIGISLLGYTPGGGKLPAETMKLAAGDTMTVGLETTEGLNFTRTFKRDGSKITQSIKLDPAKGEKSIAEKEETIEINFGKFPVMLDFGEFLNLTDTKRREFIYDLAAAGNDEEGFSDGVAKDQIKQILTERLALDGTADTEQVKILEENITECVDQYGGETNADGLQAMYDYAKEQTSYWKKERDKAAGASQKISEYKNDLAETDRDIVKNKATLEELRTEYTELAVEIAKAIEYNTASSDANARIRAIQDEIADIEAQTNPADPAEIRELIAQYTGDIRHVDNADKIGALRVQLAALQGQKQQEETNREYKLEQYNYLKAKSDAADDLIKKIDGACGACALDPKIKCDKDFTETIDTLNKDKKIAAAEIAKIREEGQDLKVKLENTTQRIADIEAEIAALQKEEIDTLRESQDIQNLIKDLQTDLKKAENFDSDRKIRLSLKGDELHAAAASPAASPEAPMWGFIDTTEQTTRAAVNAQETAKLVAKIDEQTKAKNALENLKNSIVDSTIAGYHADNWKNIADAVGTKGLQGELVKDALAPLRTEIQEKLRQMDIKNAFYFQTESDSGKEVFQFGWTDERGSRRNFDALSTGEQLLLLIAVMTTIIERLNPPLKLLVIDNVDRLDHDNLQRVFRGLATAGTTMNNIILCGVMDLIDLDPENDGWRVWDLSEVDE